MRAPFGHLIILLLVLSLAFPVSAAAQVVKLAGASAQESKQRETAQTPAAPRVGVDESRPLALTVFDAVKMALEQNREIEVERLNVRQAEYDLFAAHGANDISVGASSFYEHRTVPVGSVHSLTERSGNRRRSTWSVVQDTVATVGMPSRW